MLGASDSYKQAGWFLPGKFPTSNQGQGCMTVAKTALLWLRSWVASLFEFEITFPFWVAIANRRWDRKVAIRGGGFLFFLFTFPLARRSASVKPQYFPSSSHLTKNSAYKQRSIGTTTRCTPARANKWSCILLLKSLSGQ